VKKDLSAVEHFKIRGTVLHYPEFMFFITEPAPKSSIGHLTIGAKMPVVEMIRGLPHKFQL